MKSKVANEMMIADYLEDVIFVSSFCIIIFVALYRRGSSVRLFSKQSRR